MERAILNLRSDHEAIVVAIRVLDRLSSAVRRGDRKVLADLPALLVFLDEFVGHWHVGKEESYLMPALAAHAEAQPQLPWTELLVEHERGRRIVKELLAAIGTGFDSERLYRMAAEYVDLARNHIQKENSVLFPLALRLLSGQELETLAARFREHEAKAITPSRSEELRRSLEILKKRYLEASWHDSLSSIRGEEARRDSVLDRPHASLEERR